jgi:hypothetical protein
VIHLDEKAAPPQVGPLVAYCLDKAYDFTLICSQSAVARSHWPAEESHRVALLHEHGPEAERRRVTLHDEQRGEVGHGEDKGCRDGRFEGRECCCGGLIPAEDIFLEKCCKGAATVP